jgi:hypothetical protein
MPSPIRFFLVLAFLAVAALLAPAAGVAAAKELKVTIFGSDYVPPGNFMVSSLAIRGTSDTPLNGKLTIKIVSPAEASFVGVQVNEGPSFECSTSGQETECTADVTGWPPERSLSYRVLHEVESQASGVLSGQIEVSGGGTSEILTIPISATAGPIGPFGTKAFNPVATDETEAPATRAGSSPSAVNTKFEFLAGSYHVAGLPIPELEIVAPPELPRDIVVHAPAGLVGFPTATAARCTLAELITNTELQNVPACPQDSQIGMVELSFAGFSGIMTPLFNLVPAPGMPAQFGFNAWGSVVTLNADLRPTDNGVDIVSAMVPTPLLLDAVEVEMWGVPADSSHDRMRPDCLSNGGYGAGGSLCPSSATRTPFLRMPTSCSGELPWKSEVDTWEHPGIWHTREASSPGMIDCETVPFDPSISTAPSERSTSTPTGLDVRLAMPQENAPGGIFQADLRKASLALPAGFSLSPAAAGGLEACTDSQLRLGLEGPAECPEASRLGTVEVDTPLLDETLGGSVYLRTQNSQEPESGEMYRLAIVLHSAERGVDVKLPGSLVVDKTTGQLTTTFDELPQLPFESMQLHLKAGPRAPLTTPSACGQYAAKATLTGWNGKIVTAEPSLTVDEGCDAPGFNPGFEAGSVDPTAGAFSPFTLRVTRGSGMPNLSRISATLPEGELAKLAGVPVCGDAQATTGACPASSRIGKVTTGVGEGSEPLYLPQPGKSPTAVYLAGPYRDAPYSVVAAVPAQSGPFDLGTVTVRSALRIDPETIQATVASDPLPQIFGGIPVSYRDVRVEVDRPEFTLNPTDCEPTAVTGAIASSTGATASVSDRFQVGDCAALGFKPKLSITLKGQTRRAGHPALTAVVTYPKKGDYANIARTSVALPHSEFLAQSHIETSCTRVQYNAGAGGGSECPKGSVYGRARAFSPLLDRPLEGPVYLRSNGGERELPDLVASLGGQIHVDLVGYVDTDKNTGGLRTTFAKVPDAPVSKFVLMMPAGKKSLLENSTNICRGKHRAIVKMKGQNGRTSNLRPLMRARCGKRAHQR